LQRRDARPPRLARRLERPSPGAKHRSPRESFASPSTAMTHDLLRRSRHAAVALASLALALGASGCSHESRAGVEAKPATPPLHVETVVVAEQQVPQVLR